MRNSPGAADAGNAILVQNTNGLLDPDGTAAFPTEPGADAGVGTPIPVLCFPKILNGDLLPNDVGTRCKNAPLSGKNNDDLSNLRLATTTDGITFTALGIVSGLNDPTTADYTQTR